MVLRRPLLLVASALPLAAASGAQRGVLRLAFQDTENEPYQLGNGPEIHPQRPGLAVELVRMAAERSGWAPQFERLPWRRALDHLRAHLVDGVFGASFAPERLELGVYPMRDGQVDPGRRAYRNAYRLYARVDTPPQWDGKTLTELTGPVGAQRGYSVVADLKNLGVAVDEGLSLRGDFHKLMLGHIGAVAALEAAADGWLDRHPDIARKIRKVGPPLSTKDYYLLLAKGFVAAQPQAADALWRRLAELRDGPEMDRLLRKYLGP